MAGPDQAALGFSGLQTLLSPGSLTHPVLMLCWQQAALAVPGALYCCRHAFACSSVSPELEAHAYLRRALGAYLDREAIHEVP